MVSVETILVALISGSLGGAFATWLQTRHESRQAFRERMIAAADDLSTGLLQASLGVEEARDACSRRGFVDAQNRLTIRRPIREDPGRDQRHIQSGGFPDRRS